MKIVVLFAAIAGVLYGLWVLLLWNQQGRMAYPIAGFPAGPSRPPRDADVRWVEAGGARVETWFLPARNAPAPRTPAVLLAHGNGERIDDLPEAAAPLRDLGVSVLLVEYPGYGRSAGVPSEDSIRKTFAGAYDLLAGRSDVDPGKIVVFGHSLGGGAVCTLLGAKPVAATILLSAFSSARIFAARYFAPGFLVRDTYDNAAALRTYGGPVLILHGTRDEVVPVASAGRLHDAAPRARVVTYPCGHDCWDGPGVPMWRDVASFLTEAGVLETRAGR